MIGKIVEHILEAKFTVTVSPREDMITFRIGKVIGKEVCAIDWALSGIELANAPEYLLLDECEWKLKELRAAIEQKIATFLPDLSQIIKEERKTATSARVEGGQPQ